MASGPRDSSEETTIPVSRSPIERRRDSPEQERNTHPIFVNPIVAYEPTSMVQELMNNNQGINTGVADKSYHKAESALVPNQISSQPREKRLYQQCGKGNVSNDGRLDTVEEAIRELRYGQTATTNELAATKRELNASRAAQAATASQLEKHEKLHQKHSQVVNELKREINAKDHKIRRLEEEMLNLKSKVAESEALRSQVACLKGELDRERQEKGELHQRLIEMEKKCATAEATSSAQRDINQKLMQMLATRMQPQDDPWHSALASGGSQSSQEPSPTSSARATPTTGQRVRHPMRFASYSSSVGSSSMDDPLDELLERQASLEPPPPPGGSHD